MGEFRKFRLSVMAAVCLAALGGTPALVYASEAELMQKIDALQKELESLKAQVQKVQADVKTPAKPAAAASGQKSDVEPVDSLRKYFAAVPKGEAPATSARTGLTIYGRIDLGYESNDDGAVRRKVLNSYSSRIGFKGTRVMSDDLTGIMQVEQKIAPDEDTNSGAWASRESYAGLMSKAAGTIKLGRHDSPFKDLEGYGAPMWGSGDAMEVIIHGKGTSRAAGSTWANFHTRFPNVAQYETPRFGDVEAKFAYSTDEVNGATGTVSKPAWAGSVDWDNGSWEAGVAYQSTSNFNGQGKDLNGVKASLGGKMGDFTMGFLWSKIDNDVGKKTNNWSLAGTYKMGPTVLKASYADSSETASNAADGLKMVGFEVDYALDKHTAVYAYYSRITNDAKARGRFEQGENTYTPAAGNDPSLFAVAIRYNF